MTDLQLFNAELQLEIELERYGSSWSVDELMVKGWKSAHFNSHYSKFKKVNPTPDSLRDAEDHVLAFIREFNYALDAGKSESARSYVYAQIWRVKLETGRIFRSEQRESVQVAAQARVSRAALYQALGHELKRVRDNSLTTEEAFIEGVQFSLSSLVSLAGDRETAKYLEAAVLRLENYVKDMVHEVTSSK